MDLTEQRISMALAPRPVKFFSSVGSTNDVACEWMQQGALKGAIVVADEQTTGRGRMDRTWYTPPGVAIAVSVILRINAEHLPQVNMVGTLAISDLLQALTIPDVAIKWPNDVQVDGRKISGILPEAVWDGDVLAGVVLGMGLNVRNDFAGTPLEETATTIEVVTGKTQDRSALLAVLMFHLDKWLNLLGTDDVLASYRSRMTLAGSEITVQRANGEMITGIATDVQPDGGLVVQREAGGDIIVYDGDVTVVAGGSG